MAVPMTESFVLQRSRESDPIFELLRRGDFEDVTRRRRAAAIRVMRRSRDGLSVYVRTDSSNGRELARARARYTVVYEGEDEHGQDVQWTILEAEAPRTVLEFLELLQLHVHRTRNCVEVRLQTEPERRVLIEQCASFDNPKVRDSITRSLATIAMRPLSESALMGFAAAVFSQVDDWMMHRGHEHAIGER